MSVSVSLPECLQQPVRRRSGDGKMQTLLHHSSVFLCLKQQVNLVLDDGRSLGLMIRGGAEYALGIYITGVDQGSAAECGGLKVLHR